MNKVRWWGRGMKSKGGEMAGIEVKYIEKVGVGFFFFKQRTAYEISA